MKRQPHLDHEPSYNRIHRVVVRAIGAIHQAYPEVYEELQEVADSLHHPAQGRAAVPQILFYSNRDLKSDSERAALERRIAIWFYLTFRLKAGRLADTDRLKNFYEELARATTNGLYDLGGNDDIELAAFIEEQMGWKETDFSVS